MRLFFLLILLSAPALSADCRTSNNDIPSGGTFTCDNLYVDAPLTIGNHADPVIINVTEEVIISEDITIDGANGANIPALTDAPGGQGGPGAGDGGGRNFSPPQSGQDTDFPASTSNGEAVANGNGTCGNGGGGGGFRLAGSEGRQCTGGDPTKADGGTVTPAVEFDFTVALFRGGFGGGAGDESGGLELGSGGGGGGALYINAGGKITIESGVTISARGGSGGNGLVDGGGGGGGSGGAVWLKTTDTISMLGIIDVRGGSGGTSPNPFQGNGGAGGSGVYRLESSAGTTSGTGRLLPSNPTVSAQSLKSDISCGTVKRNDGQVFQMGLGFALAFALVWLFRTFKFLPRP